jgi:hypothetical protein
MRILDLPPKEAEAIADLWRMIGGTVRHYAADVKDKKATVALNAHRSDFKEHWNVLNQLISETMRPEECMAEIVRLMKLYQILCRDEPLNELESGPEVKDENDIPTDEESYKQESHKEIGQRIVADLKTDWNAVWGNELEAIFQKATKEDLETAKSKIANEVKGIFKAHVQIAKKSGVANGKTTDVSKLSCAGLVKVITIINNLWNQPTVAEEEKLKSIKSLVFVSTNIKPPQKHKERGPILHITPHSLDCSRVNDELWILPLSTIKDIEQNNSESVHVGDCQSCQGRVAACLEGEPTTTHEFLTLATPRTMIEMTPAAELGPISYWVGNKEGIEQLAKETDYNLFTDFNAVEKEQEEWVTNSTDYLGVCMKRLILSHERLEIFELAMGHSLNGYVKVLGASILTTKGSLSSDPIYIQPAWLPDQTEHAEPKPTTRLLFVMRMRGEEKHAPLEFLSMEADESPGPDNVLEAEWTTMRSIAMGVGVRMLDESQDFAVFNRANQLIMKIQMQYPSQGKQAYLILEMAMNHFETPDELVTSVHLPLGLKASSLNKKKTTFEATEDHQKLLKESCGPSPSTKLNTKKSKRKDPPTSEASTPKSKKKESPTKKNSSSTTKKPIDISDESSNGCEDTETGDL